MKKINNVSNTLFEGIVTHLFGKHYTYLGGIVAYLRGIVTYLGSILAYMFVVV